MAAEEKLVIENRATRCRAARIGKAILSAHNGLIDIGDKSDHRFAHGIRLTEQADDAALLFRVTQFFKRLRVYLVLACTRGPLAGVAPILVLREHGIGIQRLGIGHHRNLARGVLRHTAPVHKAFRVIGRAVHVVNTDFLGYATGDRLIFLTLHPAAERDDDAVARHLRRRAVGRVGDIGCVRQLRQQDALQLFELWGIVKVERQEVAPLDASLPAPAVRQASADKAAYVLALVLLAFGHAPVFGHHLTRAGYMLEPFYDMRPCGLVVLPYARLTAGGHGDYQFPFHVLSFLSPSCNTAPRNRRRS